MAITHSKHIYHGIWTTQDAAPVITSGLLKTVEHSLIFEFNALKCNLLNLVILPDHIHCLFEYHGELSLPTIYKNLKGGVSYHINSNKLSEVNLYWEKGYDSYSVSPSSVRNVVEYLNQQSTYHLYKTIHDELLEIRATAGL